MFLSPFTLAEAEKLLISQGVSMSRHEISEAYMIMGGIPYYLKMIDPRLSLAQNIDRLMFNPNGGLYNEFETLYRSLFNNSESYIKVVECLNSKGYGMTRSEIAETSGIKSGKTLTTILDYLESCGFIRRYNNYGCSERKSLFQLIDFFTLFHFRFMRDSSFRNLQYWTSLQRTPRFYAWAGISFEILSACHINEIKRKLGISGVATNVYSWRGKGETSDRAVQIDPVIERADNTIDICEMKFTEQEFTITKNYDHTLRHKLATFIEETKTRKSVQLVFVTSSGLLRNMYSGRVQAEVILDDLFV